MSRPNAMGHKFAWDLMCQCGTEWGEHQESLIPCDEVVRHDSGNDPETADRLRRENLEIVRMRNLGMSYRQIASEIGSNRYTIWQRHQRIVADGGQA